MKSLHPDEVLTCGGRRRWRWWHYCELRRVRVRGSSHVTEWRALVERLISTNHLLSCCCCGWLASTSPSPATCTHQKNYVMFTIYKPSPTWSKTLLLHCKPTTRTPANLVKFTVCQPLPSCSKTTCNLVIFSPSTASVMEQSIAGTLETYNMYTSKSGYT